MSSIVKRLLYLVLIIAFGSSFIANNAIFISETSTYLVSLAGMDFEITQQLFETATLISSTLNYAALLVIINVINVTNKNTEITQGTLDGKQNTTLSNQAWIMRGLIFVLETNNIGDTNERDQIVAEYEKRIPLTTNLSNTFIDFTTVDTETKIFNLRNTIQSLTLAIEDAKKINDIQTEKILSTSLTKALNNLSALTKNNVK